MRRMSSFFLFSALLLGTGVSLSAQGTVPAETTIIVTLNESLSSKDAQVGQKVSGSVAENLLVGGKTVIAKGAKATLSVASAQPSGRLKGQAKLWLKIDSIEVRGRSYTVSTRWSGQTGPSHNKRNVVAIGGGAAAGAILGGLAGGGKGAVIGAAVGAGAGTAGAAMTGKKDVNFPAETKLRFVTKSALTIN